MDAQRPSVEVVTFGCRLNTSESEVMQRLAADAGLTDTIVVNTCAVTAEATRQARQAIRRMKRENPGARIVVTGCAAQTEPEIFAEMTEVDRVIGNDEKMKAEAWGETRTALSRGPDFGVATSEKVAVNDIMAVREQALHLVDGLTGRSRAFVQVQNGCDHRCTFCIIPFGRGNSRSVPMGEVVAQVRKLVENGYREVVLTGVDITSYGQGLPGEPKLGALTKAILKHVPELERLRISSIDSVEADPDLMDVIADSGADMSHDWMRYLLTRYEPTDAPQNRIVAFLRTMYGDKVLNAPMLKSTAISDAGLTKQTLYEVERSAFTRTTYDRAIESLNAVNDEIAQLIQKTWGR